MFRLQTAPAPVLTAPACPAARGVSTTSPPMSPRTRPSPALIRPRNTGSSWETVADKGLKFHLSLSRLFPVEEHLGLNYG